MKKIEKTGQTLRPGQLL